MHLRRDYPYCLTCGTLRKGAEVASFAAPELRRGDQVFPLVKPVTTIGRTNDNDLVLDDPSVSRRHARIVRGPGGFAIEDLNSFNGTTVAGRTLHGDIATLPDETEIYIGDIGVRFAQPRSAAVGSKTMIKGTEHTMLAASQRVEEAATAGGPLSARPQRRSGWALKQVATTRDVEQWVLRNTRTDQYLQLDDRDVFLWNALDGVNTIRDLLFLYAEKYGELALPRIEKTLHTFAQLELVRGLHGQRDPEKPPLLKKIGRTLLKWLLRMELSVKGLDGLFTRMYRSFGWWFFTGTGVFLLWVLILAGLWGFFHALGHQRLFNTGGAGIWGVAAALGGYLFALAVHESAHALAVKSYGRKVTRGGFMLMMGMPFAFVDTSDMWFGTRWSRIVVALSGPLSTAAVAGSASLIAAYVPNPVVSGIAFQLAFGLYINTLYNFNPLMPLDGYQALADALHQPRLREEASAYFTKGVWADLKAGRRPGFKQWGLAAYGMAAVLGMGAFLTFALITWQNRLGDLAKEHLPPGTTIPVVILGVGIIMFPIWFRVYRAISQWVTRTILRRSGRQSKEGATA
ncbi:putative peptide zinc metalloprotease protein [Allocatelliglobosispora scoriae]|uniref:Putative peptide zinc metalloprotease protein n=1 Tax=Allocatelliglobosispora scoriae TaxID=643052 RepID=A0A841BXL3_9ACTN|nr:FHA domain-containing protein [Allocatelliglobosispora scoriae]MBB5871421.1 putative peptide zinc metalloprotease protein [Allocatelliglobosispora scoriae]